MKRYVPVLMILAAGGIAMAANVIISPNMGMPVPVVGTAPGPDWANDINASLSIIDSHDHTTGRGVPVPSAGLDINSDLSFGGNNATTLRSTRFSAQNSPISSGSDLGALYVSGVDLYYNDENGNQIRITASGSVTGSTGTITGLPSGSASAAFSASTFTFQSATNTPANMSVGPLIIGTNTASPNTVTLAPPGGLGASYNLTLPSGTPASTSLLTMDSSGNMASTTSPTITGATLTGALNSSGGSLTGGFAGSPSFSGLPAFNGGLAAQEPMSVSGAHATGVGTAFTVANGTSGDSLVLDSGSGDTNTSIRSASATHDLDFYLNSILIFKLQNTANGGGVVVEGSHATGSGTQLNVNNLSTNQNLVINSGSGNNTPHIGTSTADDLVLQTNASEVLRVKNGGGVTITGTGGNTPHGCTIRDHSCSSTNTCTSTCSAGEIVTGGGCSMLAGYRDSLSGSTSSWQCISTGTTNIVAEAICCSI